MDNGGIIFGDHTSCFNEKLKYFRKNTYDTLFSFQFLFYIMPVTVKQNVRNPEECL